MPVQISEVIIRTVVDTEASKSPDKEHKMDTVKYARCSEEIILERVFEIIQESKER